MTILQLLETQNMASACRTQYTYAVQSGNQEAGSASAVAVNKLMLTSTEVVCYSPLNGILYHSWLIGMFFVGTLLVIKFFKR